MVAALIAGTPTAAFGNPGTPDVGFSIRYDSPAECPSRVDLEEAINLRAKGARLVEASDAAIAFDVAIAQGASGASGVLVMTLPDGTRSSRDVKAETCAEAVTTLAVIAALALNGYREAKAGGTPLPPDLLQTPNAAESGEKASDAEPPPLPPTNAPERATRMDAPTRRPSTDTSSASPTRLGAFVGGTWESAVAPNAPFGGLLGVEVGWARSGAWWPIVRAGVLATLSSSFSADPGDALFRLTTARVGFCPIGWGDVSSPSIHACLEVDAGMLDARGEGDEIQEPLEQAMPWLATGPAARGEWPLGSILSLEASAGIRALFRHDRFVFRPDTPVYDVPVISAGLSVGIVGRMP